MSRHKPTNSDTPDWTLSPQQETAVALLAAGRTVTDTAEAIEVTRQTVSEWLNKNPGFEAALNSRRQELWDGMAETLRGLLPKALAVLDKELDGPQPLPAAIQVLKSCGLAQGLGRPTGPTTVEEVEQVQRQQALERSRVEVSEEDVRVAQASRQSARTLAALIALP